MVTGWHLDGTPSAIEARQREIDTLYCVHAILEAALKRYGERFAHLFAGQWSQVGDQNGGSFPSQSEADQSFCNLAANIGAEAEQIDALMRMSGLYRDKWDTRHFADGRTYGEATIAKAICRGDRGARRPLKPVADENPSPQATPALPWSDQTNAETLVQHHGEVMRYCHPWKKWLIWNGTHWAVDETGTAMRYAKDTIKQLAQQAATRVEQLDTLSPQEQTQTIQFTKHVKSSLSARRLHDLLTLAASEDGIPVDRKSLV